MRGRLSRIVLRVQLGEIIQQEHDAEFSAGSAPVSPASDAGSIEQDEEDAALLRYVNASVGGMQPNADKPLPDDVLVGICHRLAACRLLSCSDPRHGCLQVVQLNVPDDDISHGLKDDPVCSKALAFLRSM